MLPALVSPASRPKLGNLGEKWALAIAYRGRSFAFPIAIRLKWAHWLCDAHR